MNGGLKSALMIFGWQGFDARLFGKGAAGRLSKRKEINCFVQRPRSILNPLSILRPAMKYYSDDLN
jgi:hypothetical protein